MAKELFGTDGIRGIPGEYPLDDSTLDRVGLALGNYLRLEGGRGSEKPSVLIGRDTRESGPHIAERIACGLAAGGAKPVSAGSSHHAWRGLAGEPRRICRRSGDLGIAQPLPR